MGNSQTTNGFNSYSTAEQVIGDIDLKGKNFIVTGANSGIGLETCRVLAKNGAKVIMGCRTESKAMIARDKIKSEIADADVSYLLLDLSSLASVSKFSQEFAQLDLALHGLICNAGVMALPYSETFDGFEMQFGTNHLGHFLLCKLLLPQLKQGAPSRVVVVSSVAHQASGVNFDDISGKGTWYDSGLAGKWKAYGQSKTANLLFALEFDRRMRMEGVPIFCNALHPGFIETNLASNLTSGEQTFINLSAKVAAKTIPQGAATSVYVATSPDLEGIGGKYFSNCNFDTPSEHAANPVAAKKLWELSEELTKNFQ